MQSSDASRVKGPTSAGLNAAEPSEDGCNIGESDAQRGEVLKLSLGRWAHTSVPFCRGCACEYRVSRCEEAVGGVTHSKGHRLIIIPASDQRRPCSTFTKLMSQFD